MSKSAFDDPQFLADVRRSGQILSHVLRELKSKIAVGLSTLELEETAQEMILNAGGRPAFQGFQGYPFALCSCINEEIVHAFPSERQLCAGDLVTCDLGVDLNGAISDAAFTVGVGEIDADSQRVIRATEKALAAAVDFVRAGVTVRQLGRVIETEIEKENCTVVPDLTGHGCGRSVHEPPYIFNFPCMEYPDSELYEGQIICMEPIASLGSPCIRTLRNGWTIVTADGSRASQSEKMVLVTAEGCEVLAGI